MNSDNFPDILENYISREEYADVFKEISKLNLVKKYDNFVWKRDIITVESESAINTK